MTALVLAGTCDVVFTRQKQSHTIHQTGPAAYAFGGGYRWDALHAVREVEGSRHVVLVRLDLPGRIGLVPMFKNVNEFAGYRRLDATMVRHRLGEGMAIDRLFFCRCTC